MQNLRLATRALRPLVRAQSNFIRAQALRSGRQYATAVSQEMVTRTPYKRPGYAAQWACMVLIFFKNQLLLRVSFIFIAYACTIQFFGVRWTIEDEDESPN
uniref:Uncharacterized protein n=1 Tax=Eutreptiella gymnastica TaxID=73025 RepID=A0A6T1PAZ7_9EUGL|mmetsp:Transcript_21798/g.36919  ORF Transcript_21798/g.36919 Transcript_21798/m.36919 type:complete len:101 (+) Transcript_21798:49-351(+)